MTECMRARKAPWNVGFWHIGPQVNAAQCLELAEADVGDRCAHCIERAHSKVSVSVPRWAGVRCAGPKDCTIDVADSGQSSKGMYLRLRGLWRPAHVVFGSE